ncbi:hypothetical protein HMPREF1624_00901 [Sporothrix schenckii ATCC 58251]|uniref:RecA family profile 1 domain-containing protein n=1 Tax=Sporothrix schenckii (strain ATCC 58251 / de Perez 2211183) TaxID=1391915 RepID=U7Q6E5_SPOS1|nr:hypothetical protein HMPREF1624_00901 [Sporothrix schenckii ATCC 58251]
MDYHAIHGHDVANFSTPLTHRVLTVSAAEAEAALLSPSPASPTASETAPSSLRFVVSTGVATLDAILAGIDQPTQTGGDKPHSDEPTKGAEADGDATQRQASPDTATTGRNAAVGTTGGVRRGQLTEIWGPPGVGKTAFGIQLAANALRQGGSSVWIAKDCFQSLCYDRLGDVYDSRCSGFDGAKGLEDGFVHYVCPSLPHFIAMLCPQPPAQPPCIPADTTLLVIDSLSALVNSALPRAVEGKGPPLMANGKKAPSPYDKRAQVLQCVAAALERLAETRNIAVVVLTQCASRVQTERGAALAPALNGVAWDRGITTRLVLFRDWAWKDNRPVGGRFAGVQKLNGYESDTGIDSIVAFDVTEVGLIEEHYTAVPPRSSIYKRKLGETELVPRGGDDDDYGWDDEDEDNLPSMPPQWQGSEDILLGHRRYDDDGEEADEDEDEEADKDDAGGTETAAIEGGRPESKDGTSPRIQLAGTIRTPRSIADSEDDSDF